MVKKIIAVVLILVTAGAWFFLDQMNRQAIRDAEATRIAMQQARDEAKARAAAQAAAKAKLEALVLADLNNCKAEAEKAKNDFLTQHMQPSRRKRGQMVIPQSAIDEATKTQQAAEAACQSAYDTRITQGQ
jgi:hypothetical protein